MWLRERIWHPTQELRELVDGGIEISLEVPINYEIISWILGFGSAAEVIQPYSLRKAHNRGTSDSGSTLSGASYRDQGIHEKNSRSFVLI